MPGPARGGHRRPEGAFVTAPDPTPEQQAARDRARIETVAWHRALRIKENTRDQQQ